MLESAIRRWSGLGQEASKRKKAVDESTATHLQRLYRVLLVP
jgi:hypothetical protein